MLPAMVPLPANLLLSHFSGLPHVQDNSLESKSLYTLLSNFRTCHANPGFPFHYLLFCCELTELICDSGSKHRLSVYSVFASLPHAVDSVMSLALCLQVASQAHQHFRTSKIQAMVASPNTNSLAFSPDSSMFYKVHPKVSSKWM